MQVQPIIQMIINQLSIDCDRFFDQVADENQAYYERMAMRGKGADEDDASAAGLNEDTRLITGLSKSIFFNLLLKNGVVLDEHEKALIAAVFGMRNQDKDKLDYEKLDNAFEGVQQQLYA